MEGGGELTNTTHPDDKDRKFEGWRIIGLVGWLYCTYIHTYIYVCNGRILALIGLADGSGYNCVHGVE